MALTVGSRLGHYDVTALIDEGGMGQVYQAADTQLGRDVAFVRPVARGDHFTVVYLRPVFVAMGGGSFLLVGGLLARLVVAVRRRSHRRISRSTVAGTRK